MALSISIGLILIIIGAFGLLLDLMISAFDETSSTILCLIVFNCEKNPVPGLVIIVVWLVIIALGIWLVWEAKNSPPSSRRSIPPSSKRYVG